MSGDHDPISEHLRRLAGYAPAFDHTKHITTEGPPRRVTGPVAVAACVVLVVATATLAASLVTDRFGSSRPADLKIASSSTAASPPSASTSPGDTMEIPAVAAWPRVSLAQCHDWAPADHDSVVVVTELDASCINAAPRAVTTVFLATYQDEAPFGGTWEAQTDEWREIGGHGVRRLARGPMAEMNSRVVDAVVCRACNQVVVVTGPDPAAVRGIVEGVTD